MKQLIIVADMEGASGIFERESKKIANLVFTRGYR